ncbi:MAG: methylenetetrahydrofolate reductase [Actinomycetales bacterium]|nr:methylenetetrahydrofolate reductase [Actinomycetales bacterium]
MSDFVTPPRTPLNPEAKKSVFSLLKARAAMGQKSLSFEFFPPRDGAEEGLWNTFDAVLGVNADFISVTYGAGGSNQAKSFEVLDRMAPEILTVGHLTCIGASRASTLATVKRFEQAGVRTVLALRGDSPKDNPDALAQGELKTALELVELVHAQTDLEIGVAAFPEVHPESGSLDHDAKVLAMKQAAGASFAVTQLFFGVEHYTQMLAAGASAGVNIPVIPGLMPVSNAKQLLRMAAMSGAAVPAELAAKLEHSDEAEARAIGMEYTIQLGKDLLAAGAPGLHIFTLNKPEAALELAAGVGLI